MLRSSEKIQQTAQDAHSKLSLLPSNDSTRDAISNFETILQHENSRTRVTVRSEIASLRDVILKAIVENQANVTATLSATSQLNSDNSANIAAQVGRQLVNSPSSLKEVCEKVDQVEWLDLRGSSRRHRSMKCKCNQVNVRKQSAWRKGPFTVEYDFRAAHVTQCPYYRLHRRSWSYSLSARLLPFVQRAVQITFEATFGAGGSSIGPSLRYFGVVDRSNSPAFQLFDDFPDRCACRIYPFRRTFDQGIYRVSEGQSWQLEKSSHEYFYFKWDPELLKTEIPKLRRDLSLLLSTDRSSAAYSDKFGNTLLHASISVK